MIVPADGMRAAAKKGTSARPLGSSEIKLHRFPILAIGAPMAAPKAGIRWRTRGGTGRALGVGSPAGFQAPRRQWCRAKCRSDCQHNGKSPTRAGDPPAIVSLQTEPLSVPGTTNGWAGSGVDVADLPTGRAEDDRTTGPLSSRFVRPTACSNGSHLHQKRFALFPA
jgi:hypothetical protein